MGAATGVVVLISCEPALFLSRRPSSSSISLFILFCEGLGTLNKILQFLLLLSVQSMFFIFNYIYVLQFRLGIPEEPILALSQ